MPRGGARGDLVAFRIDEPFHPAVGLFVEVVAADKRGKNRQVADVRKIGAHDTPKNTVAITTVSNLADPAGRAKSYDFLLNEDIIIRKETQYFLGDEYNHFVPAGKKKLLLLFPKDQLSIENYLKENKVDFDNKGDLEKLAQFLDQLH